MSLTEDKLGCSSLEEVDAIPWMHVGLGDLDSRSALHAPLSG